MKLGTGYTTRVLNAPVIEPGFIKWIPLWDLNFNSWECPLINTYTPISLALLLKAY
jgi:hypothetical protein